MKTFNFRPWILSSSRLKQKPCSCRIGLLASSSRAQGWGARLTVTAAAQWDTCPWLSQGFVGTVGQALCRDCAENSFPFLEKQINFLWKNLDLDRFSLRRIYSDLCLSVVAFWLGPLKIKATPCCCGLLLWEASELWILWVDPRSLNLPAQG